VKRLVSQNPGLLFSRGGFGNTPIAGAARAGHASVVRFLLDKGAGANDPAGAVSPLEWAAFEGHTPVVKLLLERGADPCKANTGTTPLMGAAKEGHTETVRCLLRNEAALTTIDSTDHTGATALWWACCKGHAMAARSLMEAGADPTIFNNDALSPKVVARQNGHGECVKAIEVRGALNGECHRLACFDKGWKGASGKEMI
jgi:ankyrin repeat protein